LSRAEPREAKAEIKIVLNKYKVILILCISILAFVNAYSQDKSDAKIKIIEGRKFYVHTVMRGETLYGIAQKYTVQIKEIVLENPLTINGLSPGQTIKIPVPIMVSDTKALDGKFFYHDVQAGETFYSLSRQYSVSIENINLANPEIINGLKAGTTIRIPVTRKMHEEQADIGQPSFQVEEQTGDASQQDTIVGGADSSSSNIDSIAYLGLIKDSIVFRDTYNIAIMLPLYLDMNDSMESKRKREDPVKIFERSKVALEFYEGVLIAIDSMRKQGFSANIFVYDTKNDTAEVKKILKREEMLNVDMIIGPLYRANLMVMLDTAEERNIKMVSPFITTNRIIKTHSNLSKVKPSVQVCIERLAEYIYNTYLDDSARIYGPKNLLIIHNDDPGEKLLSEIFVKKINSFTANKADSSIVPDKIPIKVIGYSEREMEAVNEALSLADTNIVIVPSRDQVFVSKLIANLNRKDEEYSHIVFGLPVWKYFNNLESGQRHNLNIHIASPNFIDYDREEVKRFEHQYVNRFNVYPSNYAFEGFDIAYYYLNILKEYGYNFQTYLPDAEKDLLQASYSFKKDGIEGGYENKNVFILRYEDYKLILAD